MYVVEGQPSPGKHALHVACVFGELRGRHGRFQIVQARGEGGCFGRDLSHDFEDSLATLGGVGVLGQVVLYPGWEMIAHRIDFVSHLLQQVVQAFRLARQQSRHTDGGKDQRQDRRCGDQGESGDLADRHAHAHAPELARDNVDQLMDQQAGQKGRQKVEQEDSD